MSVNVSNTNFAGKDIRGLVILSQSGSVSKSTLYDGDTECSFSLTDGTEFPNSLRNYKDITFDDVDVGRTVTEFTDADFSGSTFTLNSAMQGINFKKCNFDNCTISASISNCTFDRCTFTGATLQEDCKIDDQSTFKFCVFNQAHVLCTVPNAVRCIYDNLTTFREVGVEFGEPGGTDGVRATGTVVIYNFAVAAVNIDEAGSGYESMPTIKFTNMVEAATATASLAADKSVDAVSIDTPGRIVPSGFSLDSKFRQATVQQPFDGTSTLLSVATAIPFPLALNSMIEFSIQPRPRPSLLS